MSHPDEAGQPGPHPGQLLAALASETRLRVFAAVVLAGPGAVAAVEMVAASAGVDVEDARRALRRLASAGLVDGDVGSARARPQVFAQSARLAARMRVEADPTDLGATDEQAEVLRRFWDDGRLRSIPSQRGKRRVVLDFVAQQFEPGKLYPEPHVNRIIGRLHPDYAALRRYLVDEEFLERRQGFYWRTGGTFEVE